MAAETKSSSRDNARVTCHSHPKQTGLWGWVISPSLSVNAALKETREREQVTHEPHHSGHNSFVFTV